jgi:hypothetical protein
LKKHCPLDRRPRDAVHFCQTSGSAEEWQEDEEA